MSFFFSFLSFFYFAILVILVEKRNSNIRFDDCEYYFLPYYLGIFSRMLLRVLSQNQILVA